MPTPVDRNAEQLDMDKDREDKNSKNKSAPTKSKDLSHVPCKFFKVGSCTAGSSCPFSHGFQEPGAQKDACAWFVKGNCKFGHKCALAHILPGQPMSMDRKNKKAAQLAANASKESNGTAKGGQVKGRKETGSSIGKSALLTTTSVASRAGRPPITMPLKASISAPAPASALKDTDFASSSPQGSQEASSDVSGIQVDASSSSTLPLSSPRRPPPSPRNPAKDFGPIGSPPRSISNSGRNDLLTGTSPSQRGLNGTSFLSSSPFSSGGIPASLGSMAVDMNKGHAPLGNSGRIIHDEFDDSTITRRRKGELSIDDDEMQDFVPSSLTDLLTPEEMSRRMSRTNSSQNPVPSSVNIQSQKGIELAGVPVASLVGPGGSVGNGPHTPGGGGHRYSRSVPSQSLLGDLSSIWSTKGEAGLPASPSRLPNLGHGGTPSSFTNTGFGGRANATTPNTATSATFDHLGDDLDSATMAMLSPTNASAAFLPGLHQHYKTKQVGVPPGRAIRNASNPLYSNSGQQQSSGLAAANTGYRSGAVTSQAQNFSAISSSVYDPPSHLASSNTHVRPIPSQIAVNNHHDSSAILSPNARALQSHAPGQSLPQGLAAGYSRIHALPPMPSPGSIGTSFGGSGAFSPGVNGAFGATTVNAQYAVSSRDWAASPPGGMNGMTGDFSTTNQAGAVNAPTNATPPSNNPSNTQTLETMFSKLSYSAAASGARQQPQNLASPPGISRNASGNSSGRWGGTPLSPLSKPVVTGNDDDIFSMDG